MLPMSADMTRYTEPFQVYRHDGDCFGYVQPASVLRYAQQIAGEHAIALGITDEVYARTHTAYVLAKQALHFERVPRVDEHLTLITIPEELKRAVNKRITRVLDESGSEVALVDSRWVLIDTDRRVILRKHPEEFSTAHWSLEVEQELPMKMHKAHLEDCEHVGTHTATYSQCDMNGHMNNARYVDVICDALSTEELESSFARDIIIYYHKEVPRNGSFELYRCRLETGEWYFAGILPDGKSSFEATIALEPRT